MDRIKYMVRISIENVMALCVLCSLCVCSFVRARVLMKCYITVSWVQLVFPSLDGC